MKRGAAVSWAPDGMLAMEVREAGTPAAFPEAGTVHLLVAVAPAAVACRVAARRRARLR